MSRTHHHGEWKPWVKRPPGAYWASMTPSWHTRLYMNRPKRHDTKRLLRAILCDVDYEDTAFPLGSQKPHIYYW